jgi:hypothetical protein
MFNLTALAGRPDEDSLLRMEQDLHAECEQWGVVERLQSSKATGSDCEIRDSWCGSDAVKELDGRMEGSGPCQTSFWDELPTLPCGMK